MVRSDQQLVERMTLIWHSWFATSVVGSNPKLMLRQNRMLRAKALGSFHDLLVAVTRDPAMLLWLSGASNTKYRPNENYGRELMELFTLGADRGAYTQPDVDQQARALTGFTYDWNNPGWSNFRYEPSLHDTGVKEIFGHSGRFDWRDSCRLCVEHPLHPSFMVTKLWKYLVGAPASHSDQRALQRAYVTSGYEVRPLLEAILRHPLFYEGPRMVIPPVVYCAGLLRALDRTVETDLWAVIGELTGQLLFEPPNAAGWNYGDWLDTARLSGRFIAVYYAMDGLVLDPHSDQYPAEESASAALNSAMGYWGDPELSGATQRNLLAFSRRAQSLITANWEDVSYRILRQNALRGLIPTTPDWQTC